MSEDRTPAPRSSAGSTSGPAGSTSGPTDGGSLLRAGAIMTVLAVLLSWLPLIGPLIAGVVGGREAGSPPRALGIAILPAVILALLVGWVLAAFELPVLGAIAGFGIFLVIVIELAPLLLGAWFGASMDEGR